MSDAEVVLRLLGGVELTGPDGRQARAILSQPRRLAVLLYLATSNPGGLHRKDTVRALFWPDADGLHARQALNRAIYVLRQALGAEVVVTRGDDEVGVGPGLQCDVVRFERAVREGATEDALELYRGDLAPGFMVSGLLEFERWMETERTRLREQAVLAAMTLAQQEEGKGRLERAERWAHRAELLSPYDERATVRRIRLLDRMGDRAAALNAFEGIAERLKAGLEVEPSPETRALVEALRSRRDSRRSIEPLPAPAGPIEKPAAALPDLEARTLSPVLGRPAVAGTAIVALVVLLSSLLLRAPATTLSTARAARITSDPGIEFEPALSPDGSLVAFARLTERRALVAVRSVAGAPDGSEIRLAENDSGNQALPNWSADGQQVRYVSIPVARGQLESLTRPGSPHAISWKVVDRLGGPAGMTDLPRETRWAAWSRDGARAAFAIRDSIFAYDHAGHTTRLLAVHDGAWEPNSLSWSPDNRWVAYVNGNPFWAQGWNTAPSQIWLIDTERGNRIPVTDATHLNVSPVWLDNRQLLFVSDQEGQREVYTVELGPSGDIGPAIKVPGGTDAHSVSVSADGRRIAVAKAIARQNVWSFPLDQSRPLAPRDGRPVTVVSQVVETHDVSPDGEWLAYDTNLRGDADIYLMRLNGGPPIPLVTGPATAFSPRFSPDGKEIAYYGGGEGDDDIWVIPVAGGAPTRLTTLAGTDELPLWSPDGRSIVFRAARTGRPEAWIVTRDRLGGPWSAPRQLTNFGCAFQTWAHDGSGVICGWPKSTVLTLVSPRGRVIWWRDLAGTGLTNLGQGVFSPDGTILYVRGNRGDLAGIWAVPIAGGEPRLIVSSEDRSRVVQTYPGTINVTKDHLYLTVGEFESDIWVMDLVWR